MFQAGGHNGTHVHTFCLTSDLFAVAPVRLCPEGECIKTAAAGRLNAVPVTQPTVKASTRLENRISTVPVAFFIIFVEFTNKVVFRNKMCNVVIVRRMH